MASRMACTNPSLLRVPRLRGTALCLPQPKDQKPGLSKTLSRTSRFSWLKPIKTTGRTFPNPLGCMTLFHPARKSHCPTRPRHPKIHSHESSGRVGLDGDCPNHETREIHENIAVVVRAFSPWIVESDVEMALVVGLRPTLVWTAPLALR